MAAQMQPAVLTQSQYLINDIAQSAGLTPPFPIVPVMGNAPQLPSTVATHPNVTAHPVAELAIVAVVGLILWKAMK